MKGDVWLYTPRNDEDDASVTSEYNNVKINVSMGGDKNKEKIVVRKDSDWMEDKEEVIFLYASSEEKIDVIVDGDNKAEDDVVDAFDDSNSKDVMFVYASSIDKDVSGEDQDTVMCYEGQARQE